MAKTLYEVRIEETVTHEVYVWAESEDEAEEACRGYGEGGSVPGSVECDNDTDYTTYPVNMERIDKHMTQCVVTEDGDLEEYDPETEADALAEALGEPSSQSLIATLEARGQRRLPL